MPDSAKTLSDELDDLAQHLREAAGRDLRSDAAEDEQLTELARLRRSNLAAAARTAMHRGDRMTARVAGLTLTFPVVAVGDDYLTMEGEDRWVDIRLQDAILDVQARRIGGQTGRPAAATFRARIAELEQEGALVELLTRDEGRWTGRIEVLATDHLALSRPEGGSTYLPLGSVVAIFSRFPPRRS